MKTQIDHVNIESDMDVRQSQHVALLFYHRTDLYLLTLIDILEKVAVEKVLRATRTGNRNICYRLVLTCEVRVT